MVRYTVVVAEDDTFVADAVAQLLESAGHTVVGKAKTGEEAMWLNDSLRPDIMLMDIQMPGLDGLEAAKRIMAARPLPILVCTAFWDEKLINAATKIGVHAYIVKPCRLEDLLPAINVAVSRFEETKLLRSEVDILKETIATRKWIEKAKGIVMQTRSLSEDAAHRFLQQESQRQSRSVAELAKAIVLAQEAFSPKLYSSSKAVRSLA